MVEWSLALYELAEAFQKGLILQKDKMPSGLSMAHFFFRWQLVLLEGEFASHERKFTW